MGGSHYLTVSGKVCNCGRAGIGLSLIWFVDHAIVKPVQDAARMATEVGL